MCSSECEMVSNFIPDLGETAESTFRNKTNPKDRQMESSNSNRSSAHPSSRPLFSLYLSLICLVLFLSMTVDSAAIVKRRAISTEDTSESNETKICHSNTPCGWAVYIPVSRRVDYYMKNVCECSAEKECLKSEDDLSVSAYVYRCKKKTPPKNIEED